MQELYTKNYTILLRKVTQIKERCHVQGLEAQYCQITIAIIILVASDGNIKKKNRISTTIIKTEQQSLRAYYDGNWLRECCIGLRIDIYINGVE